MEHCSFCGASSDRAKALVAGPQHVYICDACVELCRKTIDNANNPNSEILSFDLPNSDAPARWIGSVLVHLLETRLKIGTRPPSIPHENLPEHTRVQLKALERALYRLESDVGDALFLAARSNQSGSDQSTHRSPVQSRSDRRRGDRLAPITDVFIASSGFIKYIPFDPKTIGLAPILARGITPGFLGDLSELITAGTRDAILREMTIPDVAESASPWVIRFPDAFCAHLASLQEGASIELAQELEPAVNTNGKTWALDDLDWAIGELMILANKAKSEGNPIWLWLDP